jgi:hypothetical protein
MSAANILTRAPGFVLQGAFFGENAIIEAVGRKPGMGSEIRELFITPANSSPAC